MNRFFTKSLVLIALVGAMTAFGTRADAAFLTGEVNYTGDATKDGSAVNFGDTNVEGATGDFAAIIADGDPIDHEDPMAYNPFPVAGFTPLWEHLASGLEFDLTTLTIEFESADFLVLSGTGVFRLDGWDDTPAIWGLTVNQFGEGSFSASSSVPVPEPVSLGLLGLGLAAVAARRRKKA